MHQSIPAVLIPPPPLPRANHRALAFFDFFLKILPLKDDELAMSEM